MKATIRYASQCLLIAAAMLLVASLTASAAASPPSTSQSDQEAANLAAFARLYGLIRWFHPSDEAANADWDALALSGVQQIRHAGDSTDLADRLEQFFKPVAPTVRVFPSAAPDLIPEELKMPVSDAHIGVITWQHRGLGTDYSDSIPHIYSSSRQRRWCVDGEIPDGSPHPEDPLRVQLIEGVEAWIPCALYVDPDGTFPNTARSVVPIASPTPPSRTRDFLADAIVVWNTMQHFYPYFGSVDVNWSEHLHDALLNILEKGQDYDLNDLKRDLIEPLRDGHARVGEMVTVSPYRFPGVSLTVVGEQVIVSETQEANVHRGDVVLSIDGRPAEQCLEEKMGTMSGSTHYTQALALSYLLAGSGDSSVTLELESLGGIRSEVVLKRTITQPPSTNAHDAIVELEAGIFYVDISRASTDMLSDAARLLSAAKGIVIDSRGYPLDRMWATYFAPRRLQSLTLLTPVTQFPDQVGAELDVGTTWIAPKSAAVPKCKLVFLINASAMSAAEHQLSYFRNGGIGIFVGTPTAGVNGNINFLTLPSGRAVSWTGMIARWPDGSLFHTIGIQPDVFVEPTREAISAGRDEIFETGLRVLKESLLASES